MAPHPCFSLFALGIDKRLASGSIQLDRKNVCARSETIWKANLTVFVTRKGLPKIGRGFDSQRRL